MKHAVTLAALVLASSAFAQTIDSQGAYNYVPNAGSMSPDGATGPGVVYTQRLVGRVISVGAPISKNYPIGTTCDGRSQQQGQQYPQRQGASAVDTFVGAAIGGAIGNRVGGGRGREIATAAGAATGAQYMQNQVSQQYQQYPQQQQCQTIFENRIVGWTYTAQYEHIQMQGFMQRQPQIGDNVTIIAKSTFYAGS
jgi:uncharacterized protein YcfJ